MPGGTHVQPAQALVDQPQPAIPQRGEHVQGPARHGDPLFGGRSLLAAPSGLPVGAGEPCAMVVYLRTGQGRYQPYALEGGP